MAGRELIMYQLRMGNTIIYDTRLKDLDVISPLFVPEVNMPGRLTFTMLPTHPNYNDVEKLKSFIQIYYNGKFMWEGRVIEDGQNIEVKKDIVCEGVLAYLTDSSIRPYEDTGLSPEGLFTKFINEHNADVLEWQQFQVGNVTVTDPNDYIPRYSTKYMSAWSNVTEKLTKTSLGGYLILRYDEGVRYIDYLADMPNTAVQTIQYGKNMLDFFIKSSAANTYTKVIPLGALIEDGEGDERVTIESVNDGKDYLVNETLEAIYGSRTAPTSSTTWEDVTLPSILKERGLAYLNTTAIRFKETVSLNAIDLHYEDSSIPPLQFGEYIIIEFPEMGISRRYLAKAARIPLDNPASTRFTLGDTVLSLTDSKLQVERNLENQIQTIISNYVTNAALSASNARQQQELTSLIAQNVEKILLVVSGEYTTKEGMQEAIESITTSLQILQNEVRIDFQNVTQIINNMGGETSAQFEEITKYIRFLDGAMIFGRSDSQIKLRLENDVLFFFSGADETADKETAWAYFDSGTLYVSHVRVEKSLKLSNFAFIPRPSGALSFMKVSG